LPLSSVKNGMTGYVMLRKDRFGNLVLDRKAMQILEVAQNE